MPPATKYTEDAGLKVMTIATVYDMIYSSCSPGELARIAKTCASAYSAVDEFNARVFNVNKLLSPRFFTEEEVIEFRNLQAQLQFLISGSTALQLLDRTHYPGSDLDVYTFPHNAEPLGNWLIARGWTYMSIKQGDTTFHEALAEMQPLLEDEDPARREQREKYASHSIRELFHFHKNAVRDDGSKEYLELQIIVADLCPMQAILAFHSTIVMNYIAWDHACAFYPLGTFEERRGLVTYDKDRKFKDTMLKYGSRGFRIDSNLLRSESTKGPFRFGKRFVGDGQCWTVKLNTTGIVPPSPLERLNMTINGWELGYPSDYPRKAPVGECVISSNPLRSLIFRYRYCVPKDFFQFPGLRDFMRKQGKIEWFRLRQMGTTTPGVAPGYGEPMPPGFTYWDQHLAAYKESFLSPVTEADDDDVEMDLHTT